MKPRLFSFRLNRLAVFAVMLVAVVSGYVIIMARASTALPSDINSDGKVDVFDLSILLGKWGTIGTSDINGDGKTDIYDLSLLLGHWGQTAVKTPTMSPLPPVTPTPAVTPSPTPVATGGYKVSGRFLYDPCGEKVVVRGVETPFWNPWLSPDGTFVTEIAKTGANTVRLLPYYYGQSAPTTGVSYMTIPQIDALIQKTIAAKMLPDVGIAGGATADVLLRPEVKTLLMKYQKQIVIHALGEGTQGTGRQWADTSKADIARLRAAGYTAPLYVLANTYGRNLPTILTYGQEVLDSDPLKNIVFGWQAYWGEPGNYYQNLYGMTLDQAMQKVRDAPFMIQVGLTWQTDPWMNPDAMNYQLALQDTKDYQISWLWWDWNLSNGSASLTTNGTYGSWTAPFGKIAAIDHPASLSKTSVRTKYINTGVCQ